MRMWLKWNNHLQPGQKRSSIMQMTEAFILFNSWKGAFVTYRRQSHKGEKFQTGAASLSLNAYFLYSAVAGPADTAFKWQEQQYS